MSGVVLRCPTCGTTQSHSGECDACSEGEVRYFCSNHDPGLWLDGSTCRECGARFGDAPRRHPDPGPRAAPTIPVHRTRRPEPSAIPPDVRSPRTVRRRPAAPAEPRDSPPSLTELLARVAEERESADSTVDEVPRREPPGTGATPFIVGCLLRLLLLVLLLIALAVAGLFILFGGNF